MKNKYQTLLYLLYIGTFAAAALLYWVLEGTDVVGNKQNVLYLVNVLSIGLTFVGVYLGYSFERLPFVKRRLESENLHEAQTMRRLVPYTKVFIFGFLLFHNVTLYCLAAYAQPTLKYCVLVTLVLGILVYPRFPQSTPNQP
mgnify:FL=1